MKIKVFLIAFFALIISCSAFSGDRAKTSTMYHKSYGMTHHHKHHKHHHGHMVK